MHIPKEGYTDYRLYVCNSSHKHSSVFLCYTIKLITIEKEKGLVPFIRAHKFLNCEKNKHICLNLLYSISADILYTACRDKCPTSSASVVRNTTNFNNKS